MIFEKKVIEQYKGMTFARCDDMGVAYYFSAEDFDGLKAESYPFVSAAGNRLQGYLYSYADPAQNRLIVFDHGLGGGHRSYMREIEMLCRRGWLVLAYDHTGCMESEGEGTNGLAQSLSDLNDCIEAIKADARFAGYDISVMGHSWGGFASLNICALHPEVSHVVVMSGFVSVEKMVDSFFGGMLKGFRKPVMEMEREANPRFAEFNAIESLGRTDAKVLLIYSDNDPMCRREIHYDALKGALCGRENISFLLENNKGHNPNYTQNAVALLGAYTAELAKKTKKKQLSTPEQKKQFVASFDWKGMTEQDENVWERIFALLEE